MARNLELFIYNHFNGFLSVFKCQDEKCTGWRLPNDMGTSKFKMAAMLAIAYTKVLEMNIILTMIVLESILSALNSGFKTTRICWMLILYWYDQCNVIKWQYVNKKRWIPLVQNSLNCP